MTESITAITNTFLIFTLLFPVVLSIFKLRLSRSHIKKYISNNNNYWVDDKNTMWNLKSTSRNVLRTLNTFAFLMLFYIWYDLNNSGGDIEQTFTYGIGQLNAYWASAVFPIYYYFDNLLGKNLNLYLRSIDPYRNSFSSAIFHANSIRYALIMNLWTDSLVSSKLEISLNVLSKEDHKNSEYWGEIKKTRVIKDSKLTLKLLENLICSLD